ncbi:hypothetical protein CPB85DRAFT_733515 [Mucidula mucida]|nr:hypothetical protein CPB85DRAFT_733515 [Mucidula mucida]
MYSLLPLLLLAALAAASPMLQLRQDDDVSVVGWSTIDLDDPVATVTSTFTEYTVTTIHTAPYESVYPVTVIVSGSITEVREATITLYPTSIVDSSSADEDAEAASSGKRDGAIAGGVVGAVVVAAIAVILYMRFRNKRSPKHWRNRGDAGSWQNLDGKGAGRQVFVGQALDTKRPPSPVIATVPSPTSAAPPVFIREKHRRTSSNPFEDPSMAQYGVSDSPQTPRTATYIEMEPTVK